jgi:predicted lipoprotein
VPDFRHRVGKWEQIMKNQNLTWIILIIVLTLLFVSCTIVKNEKVSSTGSITAEEEKWKGLSYRDSTFNPQDYADAIWESVVLPRIENLAVDFHELLAGLDADENGTSRKYGFRHLEEGNHFNFAVKGTARILSVDTSSSNGFVIVDFAPFDGQADCQVSIGPVISGTKLAIRDIQDSISINDFLNQTEFARLAGALNNKVRDTVVNDIDFSQCIGREAEILGAFTYYGKGSVIDIIPVRISFSGE